MDRKHPGVPYPLVVPQVVVPQVVVPQVVVPQVVVPQVVVPHADVVPPELPALDLRIPTADEVDDYYSGRRTIADIHASWV
jgi:hypothetical protein